MTTGAVHAATSSTRISWSGQRATRPTQHPRVEFVSEKCAPVNKLCNIAQSARSRRETYIGPWLPEPVDTSSAPLGSSTGRGAGVRGLVTTRETLSYGTSSVCFPGSVRLPLPTDCRSPATRRSEHPPIGGLSSSTYRRGASHACEFSRATTASRSVYRRRPEGRSRRTGRSLRIGCGLLLRWRRSRPCSAHPDCRSRACREVHLLRSLHTSGPVSRSRGSKQMDSHRY